MREGTVAEEQRRGRDGFIVDVSRASSQSSPAPVPNTAKLFENKKYASLNLPKREARIDDGTESLELMEMFLKSGCVRRGKCLALISNYTNGARCDGLNIAPTLFFPWTVCSNFNFLLRVAISRVFPGIAVLLPGICRSLH